MGTYFAKQPNGLYCRFSSVVDSITHYNLTKEDVINYFVEKAKEEADYMLEHRLHTFEEVVDDCMPFNNTIEEIDQYVKEMGQEGGLTEPQRKRLEKIKKEIETNINSSIFQLEKR